MRSGGSSHRRRRRPRRRGRQRKGARIPRSEVRGQRLKAVHRRAQKGTNEDGRWRLRRSAGCFALQAFVRDIVEVDGRMLKRLVNSVRRNHALEHATISILLSRYGPMRIVGRAVSDGFYIYGDVPTERLRDLADEALARLQRGESHLAVSPLCGTNIAVAGVLAGVGSYVALGSGPRRIGGVSGAIIAAMLAVLAAQPLGRLVQKHYTTSPNLEGVRIVSVTPVSKRLLNVHKVRTATT